MALIRFKFDLRLKMKKKKIIDKQKIIEFYYNPNVECTCGAIFADTHRNHCKRRIRPRK